MPKTDRKKVNEILEEVLDVESSERERFFEDRSIDGEIRREVGSLLAFEDEAESSLNYPTARFTKSFFEKHFCILLQRHFLDVCR